MPKPGEQDPIEKAIEGEEGNVDKAAEALKIAKELEEKLKNQPDPAAEEQPDIDPAELINTADFKAKAKETTGMTDAQIEFTIRTAQAAASAGNAKAALAEVKIRHPDFVKFEKAITAELKQYPPDKRGNAVIIEKLYYVEKGKEAEKMPNKGSNGNGSGRQPIRGNGSPTGQGLDNGNRGESNSLDDDERYVARKMGITEKDYAKSKTTKLINDLIE